MIYFSFRWVVNALVIANCMTVRRRARSPKGSPERDALDRRDYWEMIAITLGLGVICVHDFASRTWAPLLFDGIVFVIWLLVLARRKPPKNPVPRVVGWVKDLGHRLAVVNEPVAES